MGPALIFSRTDCSHAPQRSSGHDRRRSASELTIGLIQDRACPSRTRARDCIRRPGWSSADDWFGGHAQLRGEAVLADDKQDAPGRAGINAGFPSTYGVRRAP